MSDGMSSGGLGESPSAANLVKRRWTEEGASPLGGLEWATREVRIDGAGFASVAEFPVKWSDSAAAITASKYFRRRGVGPDNGGERSLAQVVTRIATAVSRAALRFRLTDHRGSRALADEVALAMASQRMAFNSPVWFNAGLSEAYGISSKGGGSWVWDDELGAAKEAEDAYANPQCSACFILSVEDSLESIFEVAKNEARIFKFGSGSGVSVSPLRGAGEPLRGGGVSSGTLSWLRLWDAGAGGIKSGGTTRRAATMRVMGDRHPDVFDFVEWKSREEDKIDVLVAGGYSNGIEGEAQRTVSGQNSNNSVRLSDEFMRAVEADGQWQTLRVVDGKVAASFPAKKLWRSIVEAAHRCADPGVQFDDTINRWNTVPNCGRINATNPCSEFVFLDDTSCNLASINLVAFYGAGRVRGLDPSFFDAESFRHAVATTAVAMEAIVDYASYPTRAIAERTHTLRPLGIGYSNLGSLLMRMGLPYDSDEGRAVAAAVTSLMCAEAYATSARMAAVVGPFAAFEANRGPMLDVVRRHSEASRSIARTPRSDAIARAADAAWAEALELGERHGYRNAQVTVLAPTGTISFAMDCDTTGLEPDFALVNFKSLVGGGVIRQVNGAVPRALEEMGYVGDEVERIVRWVVGSCSFADAPGIDRGFLLSRGVTAEEVDAVESKLPSCHSLEAALSPRHLGQACVDRLGLAAHADGGEWRQGFSILSHWGVSAADVAAAEEHVLGRHTLEGCPGVPADVVAVFDCANRCGRSGRRFISPMGHLRMLGAVAPFLSGSASKTINLPADATVEDIERVYTEAWKMGVKCVAVYRDHCKSAQPLGTSSASTRSRESHARSILERTEPSVVGAFLASPAEALHAINSAARASVGQPARPRAEYDSAVSSARSSVPKVGERRRLPRKRGGFTQEARVGGHKIFLRTGEYADGQLGEIFIDVSKAGGTTRAMMNSFAIAVSLGLQHGVPVAEFVDAFTFTRFDPSGPVQGDENGIRFALSITDYVARVLGVHYLRRSDLAHVPPGGGAAGIDDGPADLAREVEQPPAADPQAEVDEMEICGSCGGVKRRTGRCMTCPTCGSPDGGCS